MMTQSKKCWIPSGLCFIFFFLFAHSRFNHLLIQECYHFPRYFYRFSEVFIYQEFSIFMLKPCFSKSRIFIHKVQNFWIIYFQKIDKVSQIINLLEKKRYWDFFCVESWIENAKEPNKTKPPCKNNFCIILKLRYFIFFSPHMYQKWPLGKIRKIFDRFLIDTMRSIKEGELLWNLWDYCFFQIRLVSHNTEKIDIW